MKSEIDEIATEIFGLGHDKATGFNRTIKDGEIVEDKRTSEEKFNLEVKKLKALVDAAVIEAQQEVVDKLPDCAGCTYDKDEGTHSELSKQHFAEMNLNQLRAKRSE